MINIMDSVFNGMPGSEFYRAQAFPELFPHEKRMLIENWSEQDREMYCGPTARREDTRTYTKGEGKKGG